MHKYAETCIMFHAQFFVEQKASEDGNGKRRMQEYQNRKIVLVYSIRLEDGYKVDKTAKHILYI